MGVCVPEELGGAGADFVVVRARARGALPRRRGRRGDRRGAHERRDAADRRVRHRRAAGRASSRRSRAARRSARSRSPSRAPARTRARCGRRRSPDGDGWRITGTKQWCTNGSHASTFLLFARTDSGDRRRPRRLRLPPRRRARRGDPRGGEARAPLVVDRGPPARRRVAVERDRLLHEERKGFAVAMATLDGGRIGIAAQAVGIAQAALDTARAYALEREQFGKRIARLPGDPVHARGHGDARSPRPAS